MNRSICCEQNEASEVIHAYYTSLPVYPPDRIWFYEREYIIQYIYTYIYISYKLYAFPLITFETVEIISFSFLG